MWLFLPDIGVGGCQHKLFLMGLWHLDVYSYISATFIFFLYYVMGSRFRVTLWRLLRRRATDSTCRHSCTVVCSRTEVT